MIKICCIQNLQEAQLAIQYGATAIGLVGEMPSGPGIIDDTTSAEIALSIPHNIDSFLLSSKTNAAEVIAHHQKVKSKSIQFVDQIETGEYSLIRQNLPNIRLIQVIHVINEDSIVQATTIAPFVDALLLDTGNPKAKIKVLGGTGKTHNWAISREIVKAVNIPVWLAGGLNPSNVKEAIEMVQPYGVDVCSGLRKEGILQEGLLKQFVEAVK